MNYSPELKDALLRRMLPPNNESITKISREEGISEQTLRNWRDKPERKAKGFGTLEEAREWVSLFVKWYNHDHHHSGLNFLTPYQRRSGLSDKILSKRKKVYEAAKAEHPERWNGRATRDWSLPDQQ